MKRIEELTLKLVDGELSERELTELEGLLRQNGEERVHLSVLRLEATLRGEREDLDVVDSTMERLHGRLEDHITSATMRRIRDRTAPRWKRPPRESAGRRGQRRSGPVTAVRVWAAVAVLLVAASGIAFYLFRPTDPAPSEPLATLVEATPGVVIRQGGAAFDGRPGDDVRAEAVVETPARGSASIQLAGPDNLDSGRLDLGHGTSLILGGPAPAAAFHAAHATVALRSGTVTADTLHTSEARTIVLTTPHVECELSRSRVAISVREESTLLEVWHGRASVRTPGDDVAVDVGTGHYVLASFFDPLVVRATSRGRARGDHSLHEVHRHLESRAKDHRQQQRVDSHSDRQGATRQGQVEPDESHSERGGAQERDAHSTHGDR